MKVILVLTIFVFCGSIRAQELPGREIAIPGYPKYLTPKEINGILDLIKPRDVKVRYFLYTNSNPETGLEVILGDVASLMAANFDATKPTRFIIHGWINYILSDVNILLTQALFSRGDYNVFRVDWSYNAGTPSYIEAAFRTKGVGKAVAEFIDFLVNSAGISLNTMHIYGHSLGAHVAGYAGKNVQSGKVPIIMGLDPAGPLFGLSCENSLCKNDAEYVETIQTNGRFLGQRSPVGHSSFFVNGGIYQPGCIDIPNLDIFSPNSCSHDRAFIYFAEALVNNKFVSRKCKYESRPPSFFNPCVINTPLRMGDPNNYGSSGVFNVQVNSKAPFGKGEYENRIIACPLNRKLVSQL